MNNYIKIKHTRKTKPSTSSEFHNALIDAISVLGTNDFEEWYDAANTN